jgi:translation initiation factor IF-2
VQVRTYEIIYELLEDVRRAVEGLLPTETHEIVLGHAEVRQMFKHKKRNIAGCMVVDGVARRDARVRLTRDGRVVLGDAALESLRRFKDDAKEVKEGFDCGIMIAGFDDVKEGDVLEFYTTEEKQRTLEA